MKRDRERITPHVSRITSTMHATICDLITDLVQNSIEADASEITLNIEEARKKLKVVIVDNGKGMSATVLKKAKDPFYSDGLKHAHRNVGLGLPFLLQTSEQTGGTATIESKEGVGTTVSFDFDQENVDLPMFGNFSTTAITLLSYGFNGNLTIKRSVEGKSYEVSKSELAEALGDLNDLESLTLLKQFIEENEKDILKLEDPNPK